jgi:hypothetical protein
MRGTQLTWQFYGFISGREGAVVQEWFEELDPIAQDEIINLVSHLRNRPSGQWMRPDFDPLEGEGGISELRPRNVRSSDGNAVFRIYGLRDYPTKHCYTFLHGTSKEISNDIDGKAIAKRRCWQLLQGKGGDAVEFDFTG